MSAFAELSRIDEARSPLISLTRLHQRGPASLHERGARLKFEALDWSPWAP